MCCLELSSDPHCYPTQIHSAQQCGASAAGWSIISLQLISTILSLSQCVRWRTHEERDASLNNEKDRNINDITIIIIIIIKALWAIFAFQHPFKWHINFEISEPSRKKRVQRFTFRTRFVSSAVLRGTRGRSPGIVNTLLDVFLSGWKQKLENGFDNSLSVRRIDRKLRAVWILVTIMWNYDDVGRCWDLNCLILTFFLLLYRYRCFSIVLLCYKRWKSGLKSWK